MPTSSLPCFLNQGHKLLGKQQNSHIFASMPSSALPTPSKYGPGHISSCTAHQWCFPHPRSLIDLSTQLKLLGILFPVPQIPKCSFSFHSWLSSQGSTFSRHISLLLSHLDTGQIGTVLEQINPSGLPISSAFHHSGLISVIWFLFIHIACSHTHSRHTFKKVAKNVKCLYNPTKPHLPLQPPAQLTVLLLNKHKQPQKM